MLHLSFKMCQQKQTFCFVYIRKMTTFFLNYFFLAKCRHFSQKILTSHHFMTMLIFFSFMRVLTLHHEQIHCGILTRETKSLFLLKFFK